MRSCGRRERNLYTAAMAVLPKPYRFSTYVGNLCVTRGTDVFKLGAKLGMDPIELLRMINGKVVPTKAVLSGLTKELHSNLSLLTELAAEIKP
jgi:hypothetical protein